MLLCFIDFKMASLTNIWVNQIRSKQIVLKNLTEETNFMPKDPEKDHFKPRKVDFGFLACFLKQACSLFL